MPLALDHVRNFGFVEIEGVGNYGYGAGRFSKMLETHGLKTISSFVASGSAGVR